MKRKTAYKIAIEALNENRRKFAFDHNLATYFPVAINATATKNYQRISQAMKILEAEMNHEQSNMFDWSYTIGEEAK